MTAKLVPDAEAASVLIALAPLDSRIDPYRTRILTRREFDLDECLNKGWSTGERVLIRFAGVLWQGGGCCDLGYLILGLDSEFFQAAMDAIAARRQEDFRTDAAAAFEQCMSGTA